MHKIFHIITRLDMGGSAQNTLLTCMGLTEKYKTILAHGLSLESKMTPQEEQTVRQGIKAAEQRGVRVIPIPPLVRRIDPVQDLLALFSIVRILFKERPLIVHTHSSKAGILGRLAASIARAPIIVHTPHGHVFFGHFGPLASKASLWIERAMDRVTDSMVALTEGERADYIALKVSKTHKMVIIHSGVKIQQYMGLAINVSEKKHSLGLSPTGLVVGTVGWLLPIKGPMVLLKAMARLWQQGAEATLVFVGKGDLRDELEAKALGMGVLDRMAFLGWRQDVAEIMHILDIFVLPSLNEGMGRVLVEAMAAGKPVVASRVGGIPDLVKHGHNGFLVEPGDVDGLSRAIERLSNDRELRERMGKQGKAMAQDFSVERMVEKIDALYTTLMHKKEK